MCCLHHVCSTLYNAASSCKPIPCFLFRPDTSPLHLSIGGIQAAQSIIQDGQVVSLFFCTHSSVYLHKLATVVWVFPYCRIDLQLLNKRGRILGSLPSINTPVFARAPAYSASYDEDKKGLQKMLAVYTYCLSWGGRYTPATNNNMTAATNTARNSGGKNMELQSVVAGQTYSLVALLELPTAKGDEGRLREPVRVRVSILGV